MTRVEERAALRPAFFTSAATDSIGSPISDAAISACSLWSSVMPAAAKIASSNVGGSRRTRRGPYLVFQSWLIAHLWFWRKTSTVGYVALQYETGTAIQLCRFACRNDFPRSAGGLRGARNNRRLLRPAFERRPAGIGEPVDAAFDAVEPAINVMQQNFWSVWNGWPEI